MAKVPVQTSVPKPKVGTTTKLPAKGEGVRRTLARPRQRTDAGEYDYQRDSKPREGMSDDNLCFLPEAPPLQVVLPKWTGNFPTVFRAYPAIDPTDCYTFLCGRKSAQDDAITDWTRGLPGISYVGLDRKISCILYDPRWRAKGYDPSENPYNVLYYAIKEVHKLVTNGKSEGEAMLGGRNVYNNKWLKYFKDGLGCQPNNQIGFFQGAVYQHNDKIYVAGGKPPLGLGPDDRPVVLMMGKSSSWAKSGIFALKRKLNLRVDNPPDADDIVGQFVHGDPVDIKNGSFIVMHNPEKHAAALSLLSGVGAESVTDSEAVDYEDVDDSAASGDGEEKRKGWEMSLVPEMYYDNKGKRRRARRDLTEYEDRIRQQYLWWDDVLKFPETEELCFWLAQCFRSVPNLLRFAWKDNPDFFTDEVKGALAARTQGPGAEMPVASHDDDADDDDDLEDEAPVRGRRTAAVAAAIADDDEDLDEDLDVELEDEASDDDDALDAEVDDDDGFSDDDDDDDDDSDDSEDAEDAQVSAAAAAAKRRAAQRNAAVTDEDEAAPEDDEMAKKPAVAKPKASPKAAAGKKPVAKKKK